MRIAVLKCVGVFVALGLVVFSPGVMGASKQLPLLAFDLRPVSLEINEPIYGFLRLTTNFESADEVNVYLKASLGLTEVDLRHPQPDVWIYQGQFEAAGTYNLSVDLIVEDKVESDALREGIVIVNQEIADLEDEILQETDPGERAVLEAIRDNRILERDHMSDVLESLRQTVATEVFPITVIDPNNP